MARPNLRSSLRTPSRGDLPGKQLARSPTTIRRLAGLSGAARSGPPMRSAGQLSRSDFSSRQSENRPIDPRERAAMGKVRFISAVEEVSRSDPLLAVHQSMLDTDPWLLGTPDGVVDLRTGDMKPGRQSDLITRQTSVAPAAPGTAAPEWQAFLQQATEGDRELQDFLQRWAGYCLSGDVSEEVLAFLYGAGGNGKGVYIGTISPSWAHMRSRNRWRRSPLGPGCREYYRAQMAGARLVTASETESGRVWAESQIKELTGNEAPVSARHPHGRPFSYRPQFKLQFVGNHARA